LEGEAMKNDVLHGDDHKVAVHHRKPNHIAEKLEGYLGIAIVVVGVVLLGFLIFGLAQTGTQTPPWMR
jgi:hypothetical protein